MPISVPAAALYALYELTSGREPVDPSGAEAAFNALNPDDRYYWLMAAEIVSELFDKPVGQAGKRFMMTISLENDAFNPTPAAEMINQLNRISGNYATGRVTGVCTDGNGNTVGLYRTTWRRDEPKPITGTPEHRKPRRRRASH